MGHLVVHRGENIWDSTCEAIVVTVNCKGAMGLGIALECKKRYPAIYKRYREQCQQGLWSPGKIAVFRAEPGRWIVLAATKDNWRYGTQQRWVEDCVQRIAFLHDRVNYGFRSIALPPLGCGHGGLDREWFAEMLERQYGPSAANWTSFELYM